MGNIGRVFVRDLKRLAKTPAAWSVVLFLAVLPSLYTWFNVEAFWNPYDNTGNLRVCVVNNDEGTYDDTLGHLDLGSQITESLQANDQLDWQFVSSEEAEQEVRSGKAYAAFVIPESFSADIATILSDDFNRPQLEYYVNEKSGPVAPKITDTGATTLDTTINDEFFATVSATVAQELDEKLLETGESFKTARSSAAMRLDEALASTAEAREAVKQLAETAQEARSKTSDAKLTLDDAKRHLDSMSSALRSTAELVGFAQTGLLGVGNAANTTLNATSLELSKVSSETAQALGKTAAAIDAAKTLAGMPLDSSSDLGQLLAELDRASAAAESSIDPVNQLVQSSLSITDQYRATLANTTLPTLSQNLLTLSDASSTLATTVASQKALIDQTALVLDQMNSTLAVSADALEKTDSVLKDLQDELRLVRSDLLAIGQSSAITQFVGENGIDPSKISEFMLSPTQVKSEVLYPLNAYGSAMAPLFINLTLWIGVFMLMVIIRVEVDDEGIDGLTSTQRFFGRGLLLSLLAAAQALICCAGCLVLGVQSASVGMLFLTAVIASLAYLAIQYTLSATLQHVGKAFCIILVFVQIPGATGLYPIEMTPEFFQVVYPLFPFTYGINAMREAICGFYGSHWLGYVGVLAGFWAAFVLIGIAVRPYLTNLNRMFARQIEESDIINGEAVELPARRWRMSQLIRTLTERDEYRRWITNRATTFNKLYSRLRGYSIGIAIGVPVLGTVILAFAGVEKVAVLTTWLVWFALVAAFFIVVEYLYDNISHQISLESMSDEEVRKLYASRDSVTRVMPVGDLHIDGKPPTDDRAAPFISAGENNVQAHAEDESQTASAGGDR